MTKRKTNPEKRTIFANPVLSAEDREVMARRKAEAVECIKRFFVNKPFYKPYKNAQGIVCTTIPLEILLSPSNISLVLETDNIDLAIRICQEEIAKSRQENNPLSLSGLLNDEEESRLYLNIIKEFRKLEIPIAFQSGLLLLYLYVCEGRQFI